MAVIDVLVEEKLPQKARQLGDYLAAKLEALKQYGVVREVRGRGLLLGVELVKDMKTKAPFPELGRALKQTALNNGLIMRIDPSWFAVAPALIAKEEDLDELYALIDRSLLEALEMVGA
jgi:2,2-dialkylglycine decarboxylase (pyruvate)